MVIIPVINNLPIKNSRRQYGKDPDNWTTVDESMTGAKQLYLKTLLDGARET